MSEFSRKETYNKHLPDYGNLDNETGSAPEYLFGIRENDGGVGIRQSQRNYSVPYTNADANLDTTQIYILL